MIVLSGALVLVALVLLVFGAIDRNLPYVYGSIGVSLLSLLLLFVGILQRRGELTGDEPDEAATPVTDATAEPVPALVGAGAQEADSRTAELAVPAPAPAEPEQPASRRVAPDAAPDAGLDPGDEDVLDEADDEADDEDFDEPDDDEPDGEGSGVTVLVVSGRPRYHLEGCRVLRGKDPEPLDRDDARMHGFTPCGVCKPDADETEAAPAAGSESFTEALFGGPLFADASDGEVERVPTSELPGRPVQPVLTEVEPPAAQDEPGPAAAPTVDDDQEPPAEPLDAEQPEPPAELRGDDPADDPTVGPDDTPAAEPSPDVAANPDEVVEPALSADASGPAVEDDVTDEPVHAEEPVEVAPVRASSRRSTGRRSPQTGAAVEQAPVATTVAEQEAPLEGAPAGTAPARKSPAKKAPAKKAPAKKAPAKKTPAKRAPAEAAAERAPSRAAAAKAQAAVEAPAAPAVKRPVVRAVRADALRLGAPSTGGTTTRVSARGAAPTAGASVVVVPDRDRFHRPDCRYVRGVAGATALPKASASRQGYSACGVCKP